MEKRIGDNKHPCLSPILFGNQSVKRPPTLTAHFVSWYSPCKILRNFPPVPACFSLHHKRSLFTTSKARFRSMNPTHVDFFCKIRLWITDCKTNKCSSQDLFFLKPFYSSVIMFLSSLKIFNLSFKIWQTSTDKFYL